MLNSANLPICGKRSIPQFADSPEIFNFSNLPICPICRFAGNFQFQQFADLPEIFNFSNLPICPVIRWAINEIDQEHTSVFLRRRYSDFICQVPSTEARRLLIISGAVEIFARRSRASPSSCIADAATQILSRYAMDLAAEECITYVESLRNSPRQGERSLKLLVKLKDKKFYTSIFSLVLRFFFIWKFDFKRNYVFFLIHSKFFKFRILFFLLKIIHSNLTIPLTPGSWSNESNRVDVISLLLALNPNPCDGIEAYRDNDHLIENVDQLIDMLLYSPAVKIYHKTKILHRMNERHFKTFFEQLIVDVKIESKITIGEVTGLLSSLPSCRKFPIWANCIFAGNSQFVQIADFFGNSQSVQISDLPEIPYFGKLPICRFAGLPDIFLPEVFRRFFFKDGNT
nr:hypothetical protein Y53F4A.a - Caenorhabditis elegans [Caenorhabditis elegans]